MFGKLFRKESRGPQIRYITYLSRLDKYRQVTLTLQDLPRDRKIIMLYFFDQTGEEVRQLCHAAGVVFHEPTATGMLQEGLNVVSSRELSRNHLDAEKVLAMEVHPLLSFNQEVVGHFQTSSIKEITAFMGMDEPLMQIFGSDRITELLKRLGLQEGETLDHPMISKSIVRAQEKLDEKKNLHKAEFSSQEDWMRANKNLQP